MKLILTDVVCAIGRKEREEEKSKNYIAKMDEAEEELQKILEMTKADSILKQMILSMYNIVWEAGHVLAEENYTEWFRVGIKMGLEIAEYNASENN